MVKAAAAAAAPPSFPSLAGDQLVVAAAAAAAAGQGWAGPRSPGPLFPAGLQAPGLGHQGSCDPSALLAASWGCTWTPAPGIMGNGMTKVGWGRIAQPAPAGPQSRLQPPSLTFWLSLNLCLYLCLPVTLRLYLSVCLSGAVSLSEAAKSSRGSH